MKSLLHSILFLALTVSAPAFGQLFEPAHEELAPEGELVELGQFRINLDQRNDLLTVVNLLADSKWPSPYMLNIPEYGDGCDILVLGEVPSRGKAAAIQDLGDAIDKAGVNADICFETFCYAADNMMEPFPWNAPSDDGVKMIPGSGSSGLRF